MNNRSKQWGITVLLLAILVMAMTGCAGAAKNGKDESADPVYPISINGSEILVGETTMQTLLDQGFRITVSEMTDNNEILEYEVDPDADLEANAYYSGGAIWITDTVYALISIVTDEENVKMGDAVIARLEFSLTSDDKSGLDNILLDGVPVTEISREKAGEMFPDFTGDDTMWFSPSSMLDYEYFMSFSSEDTMMNSFYAEKNYDVDWSGAE